MSMDSTPQQLLQRFCYIGSKEPVFVHQRHDIDVEKYFAYVQELVKELDDLTFTATLKPILIDTTLPRRDEALFVLAVYFEAEVKPSCKANLVKVFPSLVTSDDDLFLFCKQAALIKAYQNRNGFSKTIRKAVVLWYASKSKLELRDMWIKKRGANGFSHKILIQLFHINDDTVFSKDEDKSEIDDMYFKSCKEVVQHWQNPSAVKKRKTNEVEENNKNGDENADDSCETPTAATSSTTVCNDDSFKLKITPFIVSIAKLRTTQDKAEALQIIREQELKYEEVPFRLLRYTSIVEEILPRMSYIQILEFWRYIIRYKHYMHSSIQKLCTRLLENKMLLKQSNIPPVRMLLLIDAMGAKFLSAEMKFKNILGGKMPSLRNIYRNSYGFDKQRGFRMHITINLETFYKNKFLKNHRKLTYFEAAVSLAFGFYKRERDCFVYHWIPNKWEISKIAWTPNMTIDEALDFCNAIQNYKNPQNLITPINNVLAEKTRVFDVLLAIVPKNGRSNPNNSSETLCKVFERYREKRNPKAKFVIVNLMKFKKSMSYNCARNDHILEICGLDEHTVNLIDNFVQERFY